MAGVRRRIHGLEYLSYVGARPLGSEGEQPHSIFRAPVEFDKEIPVGLWAGTSKKPALLKCKTSRFSRVDDHVRSQVALESNSEIKNKWEIRVRLFDERAREVIIATEVVKPSGVIPGQPISSVKMIEFSFGQGWKISCAESFEIRIRQIKSEKPAGQVEGYEKEVKQ